MMPAVALQNLWNASDSIFVSTDVLLSARLLVEMVGRHAR
jgi:hypothetical protein